MSKTPHDILVTEKFESPDREEKTKYTNVGVAFELDNGGFSCKVAEGVALTGSFIIKERKPKDAK